MADVTEQEGNVQHADLWQCAQQAKASGDRQVDAAELHALQQLRIRTKLAIGKLLHREAATGAFGDFLGKDHRSGADLRLQGQDMAQAQYLGGGSAASADPRSGKAGGAGKQNVPAYEHGASSGWLRKPETKDECRGR